MKRLFLMIGLLLSFLQLYSWDLSGIVGGRSNSMGNCSVALSDFWSIANNPAGIAGAQHVMAGFAYDNRFFMKELSNYAAAFDTADKKDFYEFTLALDALKQSLNGSEKTVVLDGNSALAKILMGNPE